MKKGKKLIKSILFEIITKQNITTKKILETAIINSTQLYLTECQNPLEIHQIIAHRHFQTETQQEAWKHHWQATNPKLHWWEGKRQENISDFLNKYLFQFKLKIVDNDTKLLKRKSYQ